jgi:hypothetical protein
MSVSASEPLSILINYKYVPIPIILKDLKLINKLTLTYGTVPVRYLYGCTVRYRTLVYRTEYQHKVRYVGTVSPYGTSVCYRKH